MRGRTVRPARIGDWRVNPTPRALETIDDRLDECDRCGRLTRSLGDHAHRNDGGFPACRPRDHRYHDHRGKVPR